MQKQEIKIHNQISIIQTTLQKRYGYQEQQREINVAQQIQVLPTDYVGCISDQDNKEVIKQLKFTYLKWFAKNNCFALGYNKVNNLRRQGHYAIFDLYDWKLHYKKFAVDEAMVGLVSQEYLNKVFGLGSNGGIYSIEKGQEKLEQRPVYETGIIGVSDGSFSPNHFKLCLSSIDKLIYIIDVNCGVKEVLSGHGKEINSVQWNPTFSLLVSGGEDESIRLWDPSKREELVSLKRHNLGVRKVRWSNDGLYFLSTSKDKQTMLFDIRRVETEILKFPQAEIMSWHPQFDNIFMLGDQYGTISGWNISAPQEPIYMVKKADSSITDFSIDSMGQYMGLIRAKQLIDQKVNTADTIEILKMR